MRRVHVVELPPPGGCARLSAQGSHHLLVVCRVPRGAPLLLFDGSGAEAEARLEAVEGGIASVRVTRHRARSALPSPLHVVVANPKGPAMDRALRMATEIGATHVHPAVADRTVPRGDRHERWIRILHAACEQCGRVAVPSLSPLRPLAEALAAVPDTYARYIAAPGAPLLGPVPGPAALAVGPEGGLTEEELDQAASDGWIQAGLGPWTLRADTAVAVGLTRLRSEVRS